MEQALIRELREELGIAVEQLQPWQCIERAGLRLHVLHVSQWHGQPRGMEGQRIGWFTVNELVKPELPMPPADQCVAESLFAPLLAITPTTVLQLPPRADVIAYWRDRGVRRVLLRALEWKKNDTLAGEHAQGWLAEIQAAGLEVIVHHDLLSLLPAWDGPVHLPQRMLETMVPESGCAFSVSCHDGESLRLAEQVGARFALLSPVLPTQSHPHAAVLGWQGFQQLVRDCDLSVYALGGLQASDLVEARLHGAVGVAGIRAFWPPLFSG